MIGGIAMTFWRRLSSYIILAGCLMAAGTVCSVARGASMGDAARVEKPAADSGLPVIDLSAYKAIVAGNRGGALMVTFWATWCEPCRDEFPMIADLAKKYGPAGLTVIGVNLDDEASVASAKQFLEQAHVTFANYRVKQGIDVNAFYQAVNPAWQGMLPQTVFYARDGHVARYLTGAHPPAAFEDAVRLILVK
jgi:thiol-disulfide isomerase/thioredoxin